MKTSRYLPFFLAAMLFSAASAVAEESSVSPQNLTPVLSEKTAWSYVFIKPAAIWMKQYPLPNGGFCVGAMSTKNHWPMDKPSVWMTAKLTLPEDYTPGRLYARVRHDDNIIVFINGEPVYHQIGCPISEYYQKFIPNALVPGENIIAVCCENIGGDGHAEVTLWADDAPPLDAVLITPVQGKWSYTFDDPGSKWVGQFPLPGGKSASGPFLYRVLWENGRSKIWMTQVVTLPEDYVPEELMMQFCSNYHFGLYINGEQVAYKGYHGNEWHMVRGIENNPLKPGKNIIAVWGERRQGYANALVGVELFTRQYTAEERAEMNKNPLEHLQRPPRPEDVDEGEDEVVDEAVNPSAEEAKPLTPFEKKIQLGMNCLKLGQEELGITTLEKAAEEDEKDFTANGVLGMYALTKLDSPAKAYAYFMKCVKANPKDPSVLNNYAVAAMENKKFDLALQSWERLAKIDATLPVLGQNVGCFMDLLNKKRITLKEPEKLRLVELYIATCAEQGRDRNPALGFMLLPFPNGVAHRPDCDAVFVQKFKRGSETVTCRPYEVKKTYYGK